MRKEPTPISAANSRFAAFTFEKRFPFIIHQIKTNNQLSRWQEMEFDKLLSEVQTGVASPLKEYFYPADWPFWEKFTVKYYGKRYVEIPFYEAEAYAYHRIIDIMDYRHSHLDPFDKLKTESVKHNRDFLEAFSRKHLNEEPIFNASYFNALLYNSLWANSADLSQLDANGVLLNSTLRRKLVIDDTDALATLLNAPSTTQVDFIADNAGIELISDFFLIDYLLYTNKIAQINLHLKHYPIFVSDATVADVRKHLELLNSFQSSAITQFADRLLTYCRGGRIKLDSHPFWNSPCHFTELPITLKQHFDSGTVLLFKGDANYRRLFEDRLWPPNTPTDQVLNYLDHPCVSIRTLKSEIVLGLSDREVDFLFDEDKNWLTNGTYGLIMVNRPLIDRAV